MHAACTQDTPDTHQFRIIELDPGTVQVKINPLNPDNLARGKKRLITLGDADIDIHMRIYVQTLAGEDPHAVGADIPQLPRSCRLGFGAEIPHGEIIREAHE